MQDGAGRRIHVQQNPPARDREVFIVDGPPQFPRHLPPFVRVRKVAVQAGAGSGHVLGGRVGDGGDNLAVVPPDSKSRTGYLGLVLWVSGGSGSIPVSARSRGLAEAAGASGAAVLARAGPVPVPAVIVA